MKIRPPILTLTLAVIAVAIHFAPSATDWLQYDRAAIARGELWRWFTGHLTHFELNHLTWDVGALLVLGGAAEHESRRDCARTLFWSAVIISTVLWFWQPQFSHYRGLSGVDTALFALVAGTLLRRRQPACIVIGTIALIAVSAKCAVEFAAGATVFAAGTSYLPVPLAHLVGIAVGLAVAFFPSDESEPVKTGAFITTAE